MKRFNSAMKKYMANKCLDSNIIKSNYQNEILFVFSHLKLVFDCVIYDSKDTISCESIDVDNILRIHGDWTGYEASINEIILNQSVFFPYSVPEISSYLLNGLKKRYPSRFFCVVISIDNDKAFIRFHTVRDDEPLWCDLNVNNYTEPVFLEIG